MRSVKEMRVVTNRKRNSWMNPMADIQVLPLLLLVCLCSTVDSHLNRLKVPRHRAGSSKFSLNPLKPLMNLMRQDPMKAAAQRVYPRYLPPPPTMYQAAMSHPARTSIASPYAMYHPYRPYNTRMLPPSTMSMIPPYMAAPSSLAYSTHYNDPIHHYRPMPSDIHYKAVRIPKVRKPAPTLDTLNIADSVVRQLLDMSQRPPSDNENPPAVLVIEDPDVASSSAQSELYGDSLTSQPQSQKVIMAPPVHADYPSDSSDISSSSINSPGGTPEVFVIVSKNKKKNNYYSDDKKSSDPLSSTASSSKLKKYKITTTYDENGDRQVWIIK